MSKSSQFTVIWQQAEAQYKTNTGEDLNDPSFPQPDTPDHLASLDKQNGDFTAFREKRAQIFNAVTAVCRPIESISEVTRGPVSTAFPAASICFGATKDFLGAAKGVSASYDAIVDLLTTLKVIKPIQIAVPHKYTYRGKVMTARIDRLKGINQQ